MNEAVERLPRRYARRAGHGRVQLLGLFIQNHRRALVLRMVDTLDVARRITFIGLTEIREPGGRYRKRAFTINKPDYSCWQEGAHPGDCDTALTRLKRMKRKSNNASGSNHSAST